MKYSVYVGAVIFVAALVGCNIDPFCLRCDDAGISPDDETPNICVPGSTELCNGWDDDCDGLIDEGFFFDSDPFNCGGCGVVCELAYALSDCVNQQCVVVSCLPGAVDGDGDPANGCERVCPVVTTVTSAYCAGGDCCDGADNDCDGIVGEDHNTATDPNNCGGCASNCDTFPCPHICAVPFATTACIDGRCTITGCDAGYFDGDGEPWNGCEIHCEPSGEEDCDGIDNDCDGDVDEEFSDQGLPCGDPSCNAGTLECLNGEVVCVLELTEIEICDDEDNDCRGSTADGSADPLVGQPCGTTGADGCPVGTTVCTAGIVTCDEELDPRGRTCGTDLGACESGVWTCVDRSFVCQGEVAPTDEICGDGMDNDCDGADDTHDDDLNIGALCDQGTGTGGVGVCSFGTLACNDDSAEVICQDFVEPATLEDCNGLDDDCNGIIDDSMTLENITCGPHPLEFGYELCRAGAYQCVGYLPVRPELCDGDDNDGDGEIDEDAVCPAESQCDHENGFCTIACNDVDEAIQCPAGLSCSDGRCVGNLCENSQCDECEICDRSTGHCVDRCLGLVCDEGLVCSCGRCWPPTCNALGCPEGQICREGRCILDTCATADCGPTQGCSEGVCFEVCTLNQCSVIERCVRGVCQEDLCNDRNCRQDEEICNPQSGECTRDCVGKECPLGEVCDISTGRCVDDPCRYVHCPAYTSCVDGSCFASSADWPDVGPDADTEYDGDAGPTLRVLATGGGGCSCSHSGAAGSAPLAVFLLTLCMGLIFLRRRSM